MKHLLLYAGLGLSFALPAAAQKNTLPANSAAVAPNAPADQTVRIAAQENEAAAALAAFDRHIAPAVKQARATLRRPSVAF
jgi:hypothetical protein